MQASDELLKKLRQFEGCKLYAYRDSGGVLTIGYGHTRNVKAGQAITERQAEELLRQDLDTAARQVEALGLDWLSQEQKEALVDFAFNLGIGRLKKSTLLKDIKDRKTDLIIVRDFMAWKFCNGKVLQGLVKRRKWEAERYVGKEIYYDESILRWYIKKG